MRIKCIKREPNRIPLSTLHSGHLFMVNHGDTVYMILDTYNITKLCKDGLSSCERKDDGLVYTVSLRSGKVYIFPEHREVIELDGNLEVYRICIERSRRDC